MFNVFYGVLFVLCGTFRISNHKPNEKIKTFDKKIQQKNKVVNKLMLITLFLVIRG